MQVRVSIGFFLVMFPWILIRGYDNVSFSEFNMPIYM